jgi:hypothetical protein
MKHLVLTILCLPAFSGATGQTWQESHINEAANIRYRSSNPTRLSYNVLNHFAAAVVDYQLQNGGFYDAAQSGNARNLNVSVGGLHRVGKTDLSGHISYHNTKEKNHRWNSTLWLNPYNDFILADSVASDVTTESFDMHAAASWRLSEILKAGLSIGLQVGSRSDQTDPRPKTGTSVIPLSAGIDYALGKAWAIGFAAGIQLYRSDISYTSIDPQKDRVYFIMKGMGDYYKRSVSSDGGYTRDYKGNTWNAALQATWTGASAQNFMELSYAAGNENAEDGGAAYTFKGGDYGHQTVAFANRLKIDRGRSMHDISVGASFLSGKATWYEQKRQVDTEHANRMYYEVLSKNRIQDLSVLNLSAAYRYTSSRKGMDSDRLYAELRTGFSSTLRKHYLGSSSPKQEISALDMGAAFGKVFRIKQATILTQLDGGYKLPLTKKYAGASNVAAEGDITGVYTARQFEYAAAAQAYAGIQADASMPAGNGLRGGMFVKASARFYTGNEAFWKGYDGESLTKASAGVYLIF